MSPPINKPCATYLWPLSVFINLWCIHLSIHRFYIGKSFYWSPWFENCTNPLPLPLLRLTIPFLLAEIWIWHTFPNIGDGNSGLFSMPRIGQFQGDLTPNWPITSGSFRDGKYLLLRCTYIFYARWTISHFLCNTQLEWFRRIGDAGCWPPRSYR